MMKVGIDSSQVHSLELQGTPTLGDELKKGDTG
jgi:hypothetical protein